VPAVAKISVKNGPNRGPAADLHLTFSGSGGDLTVDPASISVDPNTCPDDQDKPKVPSNDRATTNEVVIEWPRDCVASGAIVKFSASSSHGPLKFRTGYWTTIEGGKRKQIGPDIQPEEVTVQSSGSGHELGSLPDRIQSELLGRLATADLGHLPLELLVSLANLMRTPGALLAVVKTECACVVQKVDGQPADGWRCRCFTWNDGGAKRQSVSFQGPNWNSWVPAVGGGTRSDGTQWTTATDPSDGTIYEVDYKCNCA